MLSIDCIDVSYKNKGNEISVLKDFSLELSKGEILTILGPSGCGKSTLIQVLSGMHPVTNGSINMTTNETSLPLSTKRHNIAVMPQNCGLLPWKTVRENCLLPLKLRKIPLDREREKELKELCSSLKVEDLLERFPKKLSGGQVQRVALVRAFLQEPDLLLMDEPFSSLDAITKADAWELFLKVFEKKSPTTILVTHSIEEAMYLGKEIIVLGTKGKQLARFLNPYFGKNQMEEKDYFLLKSNLHSLLKQTQGKE